METSVTPVQVPAEQTKSLILRRFRKGDNDKIITTIKRKIYFAEDQNIEPGFYVGAVVQEMPTCGVISTIPACDLPLDMWKDVSGVYIKADRRSKKFIVQQAKPEEYRSEDDMVLNISLSDEQAKEVWGEGYDQANSSCKMYELDKYHTLETIRERIKNKKAKHMAEE